MRDKILTAGLAAMLLVILLAAMVGCEKSNPFPLMTPQPASTQPTAKTLTNAQADTREIGKTLAESSANMQLIAVDVRSDAKSAPEPVRAALEGRADRLVHESAAVGAQAKLVDPGVTRQLEAAVEQLATMQKENEKIIAGLVAQNAITAGKLADTEKQLADAESMRFWIPFLLFGMVVGFGLSFMKLHPAWKDFPFEIGGSVAVGCLIGLIYIHTQGKYPGYCAIGGFSTVLVFLALNVYRINKLQSKVAT
jgi:hypothetical protein